VSSIEFDAAATITSPTLRSKRMLVFGDSISEGCDAVGSANGPGDQDSTVSYAMLLASTFNAEVGIVGISYQGYEQVGSGNTPNFPSAYNSYTSGRSRSWTNAPDYILIDHGTNGTTTANDVQTMLTNLRAVAPSAIIFQLQTFGRVSPTFISGGVGNYKSANSTDAKVFLVDYPQSSLVNVTNSNDNLHPNVTGHQAYANGLASIILADINSLSGTVNNSTGMLKSQTHTSTGTSQGVFDK
jgi:lysophospholipase L1-like esterase